MSLTPDVFILLAVFLIVNYNAVNSEGIALNGDDEENSLKQAIFLVELLKSDFAKGLRENNYLTSNADNATENNSTCPMPTGDVENTTVPATSTDLNLASILPGFPLRSNVSAVTPATIPKVRADAGAPGYGAPGYGIPGYGAPGYGAPRYGAPGYGASGYGNPELSAPGSSSPGPGGPPLSNWPAMPNMPMPGYPVPHGYPQQRNFPADENYRLPYRFGRRRMMPDYYYFDAPPINPQGNYRRQGNNDPPGNETANTQTQTSSIPSTTSEVTSLHVEESTTKTSTFLTTVSPPSTISSTQVSPLQSTQTSSQESPLQTTQTSSQVSTLQSTQTSTQESSVQSILLTKLATEETTAPTIIQTKVGFTTPAFISKATSAIISKRKKKHKLKSATGYNLRQRKTTTTSEKYTSGDVEMSQVASELIKEFKGTPTENMPQLPSDFEKLTSRRKTSTTMKIYLKGSSRLPLPLPENNAFCHAYPRNVLCGYVM